MVRPQAIFSRLGSFAGRLERAKALGALFSALKELWPDKLDDVERAATETPSGSS